MKINEVQNIQESDHTAAFVFGRFNPPTIGHKKLFDKLKSVSDVYFVFVSATQDPKKNPLNRDQKIAIINRQFPEAGDHIVNDPSIRTIIDVMKFLENAGHKRVAMVVGSDRTKSFNDLLAKYNGKEYEFESIDIISAGDRDPDSDDVSGVSASKARQAAADGDYETFKTMFFGNEGLKKNIYKAVRTGMGIREDLKSYIEQIETNESIEDEAWELLGQDEPTIKKYVQSLGLKNDEESVKKVSPIIQKAPTQMVNPNQIPRLQNLANKPNDPQVLKSILSVRGSSDIKNKFIEIMNKRDQGEARQRGYSVGNLIDQINQNRYEPPVVLKSGSSLIVVGGRTRFYAALALNKPIRVKVLTPTNKEAAGVGIVTKQNTTKDVNKGTLSKIMKALHLK